MTISIIGGKYKRHRLRKINRNIKIRPILVRVKKSLFDIIYPRLKGANFLDLYAGSGAVGIEALSRGAAFSVFIEGNMQCIRLIKQNISDLKLTENSAVIKANVLNGLEWLRYKGLSPFDVVFMGPPYDESLVVKTLEIIKRSDILAPDALVIAQHSKREDSGEAFGMFRQKKYGDTLLSFYNFKNNELSENK